MYSLFINYEAKVFYLGLVKFAFIRVSVQFSTTELFNNKIKVFVVFLRGFQENKDVVKVYNAKVVNKLL